MDVGQICLGTLSADGADRFVGLVESMAGLAIGQHVLIGDPLVARRLESLPRVCVGPLVGTPVLAASLMPEVDVVHAHDEPGARAALLLALTRSLPFVLSGSVESPGTSDPLARAIAKRARALLDPATALPLDIARAYRRAMDDRSEFPEDADRR